MVLGQHRVSGIRALVVVEDDMLFILTASNNLIRTGGKLILDLADNRQDERRNDGKDPHRELVFKLLDDLGEDGDVLNSFGDALH